MSFYHAIYNKGGDTPTPTPTPDKKISVEVASSGLTPSGEHDSSSGEQIELTFTVNVGQVAILSVGSGDAVEAIPFNKIDPQGWSISNKDSILGSIRGGCNSTSTRDSSSLGCLVVMPTDETGTVAVSRKGGSTAWLGISYIILNVSAK